MFIFLKQNYARCIMRIIGTKYLLNVMLT